jgi:hypothetical protein
MIEFDHRGVTYLADESERVFDLSGKLLGYISSRGSQYAWGALDSDEAEFARGNGTWHSGSDEPDPAMDSILAAWADKS